MSGEDGKTEYLLSHSYSAVADGNVVSTEVSTSHFLKQKLQALFPSKSEDSDGGENCRITSNGISCSLACSAGEG